MKNIWTHQNVRCRGIKMWGSRFRWWRIFRTRFSNIYNSSHRAHTTNYYLILCTAIHSTRCSIKEGDLYRKLQSLEQRRDSLEDVILFHRWKGAFCLFVHCTHAILKKASNLHPERFYRAMLLVKSRWTHKRISLELPKLFPPSCERDSRLRIAAKIVGMLVWKSVSITSIFVGIINVAWHFIHTWLASYPLFIVVYSQFYTLGK